MDLQHYPPADPQLTYDDSLSNRLYRAYHRLFARAWNNDHVRKLVLSQAEMLKLLGCGRSTMYEHLNQLVSRKLIAYYSDDDRFVITFRVQVSGLDGFESRFLDSNGPGVQESRIPGQGESPAPLKELIKKVVVVNDSDQENQLLLLGGDESRFLDSKWPVNEICDAAGVFPGRRPGMAKGLVFVAWLIYGYQFKAETRGEGIVSPVLFAITRLEMQPAPVYLEMALAGPVVVLDAMDDWFGSTWGDVLGAAKKNGLYELLDPFFPVVDEAGDPGSE